MRGMEVNVIWVCMKQKLVFVGADSHNGEVDNVFAVSLDGVHCKRYTAEVKGRDLIVHKYGYGDEDTCSGLFAMRQYRKVQRDVMAYIEEQKRMAS